MRYRDLTDSEIRFISNGCGPASGWITKYVPQFVFRRSCDQHDVNYYIGCTEADRKKADKQFYKSMRIEISKKAWFRRPLLHLAAYIYYRAVVVGGKKSFYYADKERTYEDLRKDMITR